MKIITVLQQKGGVGKTTVTVHLAAALASMHPTLLVAVADADPQGSATIWINRGNGGIGVTAHTVAVDGDGRKGGCHGKTESDGLCKRRGGFDYNR